MSVTAPVADRLNGSFEWLDHRGPFRILTEAQARSYDENGFFVLPDALTASEVDALTAAIDPFEREAEEALRGMEGGRFFIARADEITFTTHLVPRSPVLRSFTAGALLADLCADLIGPDVRLYWDQAVYKKPGTESPFPWHQDNGYAFVEPQQYLTCWVALTDATPDNGCPQVARGLHRTGTLAHTYVEPLGFECLHDPDEVAVAEVGAGGVVVFSSLTPHLTGPNTTAFTRKAYILQYAPAGAEVLRGDPAHEPVSREPATDPTFQYPVVRGGVAVSEADR